MYGFVDLSVKLLHEDGSLVPQTKGSHTTIWCFACDKSIYIFLGFSWNESGYFVPQTRGSHTLIWCPFIFSWDLAGMKVGPLFHK